MREGEIKPSLQKTLNKLSNKDPVAYEAVLKKIDEVLACTDVNHYNNLRHDMKDKKRIHIIRSFILVFSYDEENDFISFQDYDHHDKIYK